MENNWLNLMHLLKKDYDTENTLLLKEKEIYNKMVAERNNEVNTLNNTIKYDKLTYYFNSQDKIPISFNRFNCPLVLIINVKDGSIDLGKTKENREKFRSNLNETTKGKWEHKLKEQKIILNNLKMLAKQDKKLSNCLMIILQLYLRLNMKQSMEKDS